MMNTLNNEAPVVVLGAGSAGLASAVTLARKGRKVVVIEKQPYFGGLATTIQHGPFRLDLGPHTFHCKNDEADVLFQEYSSQGYKNINMKASLLLHKKYFDYPLRFGQAIFRLEPAFTARMLWDYLATKIRSRFSEMPENSFEDWGVKRYGRTMYDMAFGNYSRKVWGMPTTQLSMKLAQQKLPDMTLLDIVKEALGRGGAKQKILYSSYAYPYMGIGTIFDAMGDAIVKEGGQILMETEPAEIIFEDNTPAAVRIKSKNGSEKIPCSALISTIPLNDFIHYCGAAVDPKVLDASHKLIYRHLMLAYLEVAKENVTNEIMVYLLDTDFTFNRIGEQKNIAPEMSPEDRSMLCFEICTDENGKWWSMSDEEFLEVAKKDLLRLGTVVPGDIKGGFVKRVEQAYPIYDLTFDKNLGAVLEWINGVDNVYSIGRQGLFLNNDIHTSMKMGIEAAGHFISGKPRQSWIDSMRRQLNWRLE